MSYWNFPASLPGALAALSLSAGSAGASPPSPGDLVAAARRQVGVTLVYDPAYVRLDYPGGDVPIGRGVCTDVVVRAYCMLGIDLQKLVHEDMKRAFSKYPQNWGLARPDKRILIIAACQICGGFSSGRVPHSAFRTTPPVFNPAIWLPAPFPAIFPTS